MKKSVFLILILSISVGFYALKQAQFINNFSISKPLNSGGAAGGKTGAPGEQNCTACHSGSTQDGSSENILKVFDGTTEVSEYTPGQTYNVTLELSSNPSKKGFQATALNGSNLMAGQFFSGSNTQLNTANNRTYANHTVSSNTSATTSWNWSWTAPSQGSGDITFYIASNKANNNGANSGDLIYLSQRTLSELSNASTINVEFNPELKILSEPNGDKKLQFELNKSCGVGINVVNMSGQSVYHNYFNSLNVGLNSVDLEFQEKKSGTYIVNVFIDNKPYKIKFIK